MRLRRVFLGVLVALIVAVALPALSAAAQQPNRLDFCREAAFSTEEDFRMGGEPADGNPFISDGDLLSPNGQVCARNIELVGRFDVQVDLGLDAVHIIRFGTAAGGPPAIIAFSTELDSPHGNFSAGDVLFTNGAVIPNIALVTLFGINWDIGLDGLQFVGDVDRVAAFADKIAEIRREDWLRAPRRLARMLREEQIDIWFSTEGTRGPIDEPILDGDLLSATGVIVQRNSDLLPGDVPAGLPDRGVDLGLDAIAAPFPTERGGIFYSTELLYRGERHFTDGDVLQQGDGIAIDHRDLIKAFDPKSDFLGLDALWLAPVGSGDPVIESICGDDHSVVDFDGGIVPIGGGGTGLYMDANYPGPMSERLRRPCGEFVPFEGSIPQTGLARFRVAYRDAGTPRPAWGVAEGIQTQWLLKVRRWIFVAGMLVPVCPTPNLADPTTYLLLQTDANGWMDASDYIDAENGTLTGCEHDLKLAVWNTNNAQPTPTLPMPPGPADPNGHYVAWLEWETTSAVMDAEAVEHHIQLDNVLPTIPVLEIRTEAGEVVPLCNVDNPAQGDTFQVWSQFDDDYYWQFGLTLYGGMGGVVGYGPHDFRFTPDGTPGVDNTDDTGTAPNATTVRIRDIHMTDLGANFVKCCYMLVITVHDSAIRSNFNRIVSNDISGSYYASTFRMFAATP